MLRIDIISAQPGMFAGFLSESIVARAVKKGLCSVATVNLRDFSEGAYGKIDDKPYGGGPGMLMTCGPWFAALKSLPPADRIVMTTPAGKPFRQTDAESLSRAEHVIFMCGHYEGFDARIETRATDFFSVGDFVMTGGELAAAAMADATVRLLPGAIGAGAAALSDESFSGAGILEAPQYTKPAVFGDMAVPEVLLSGDHAKIEAWRKAAALERTRRFRPDLDGSRRENETEGGGR